MNPIAAEAMKHLLNRRATLLRDGASGSTTTVLRPPSLALSPSRVDLAEIEQALLRIELGVYGQCEECGGAIGRQRLRAMPEARRCIACTPP